MAVPTLIPIDIPEVRKRWANYMRGGVADALRYASDGVMPEDVFASIMAGQSLVFMSFFDDDPAKGPEGFMIARPYDVANGRDMLMWIGYHNGDQHRMADYAPQFKDIARALGCNRVVVESPRPWHRAVPEMELATYTYHMRVD